jgi:hypothetical protein
MSTEVIKKARIVENRLPAINSITEGYEIRYRVVSEDKNRTSHWSPIFLVQPEFTYVSGSIDHIKNESLNTVIWSPVQIKKNESLIKEENIYDLWVRWDKDDGGDWIYNSRVVGNSVILLSPNEYSINGVVQPSHPNKLSVEIYLKGNPISRNTDFLKVYQDGPWSI